MVLPNPTISFRVPHHLYQQLEKYSKVSKRQKTKLLVEALENYLKENFKEEEKE